jgi:hypothetical protein
MTPQHLPRSRLEKVTRFKREFSEFQSELHSGSYLTGQQLASEMCKFILGKNGELLAKPGKSRLEAELSTDPLGVE